MSANLTPRNFTQPSVFSENAQTVIPENPIPGVSYRDPNINPVTYSNGQKFDVKPVAKEWNQLLYVISSCGVEGEKFGFYRWSPLTDYVIGSNVTGTDGVLYFAIRESGPTTSSGPMDPSITEGFWKSLPNYIKETMGGGDEEIALEDIEIVLNSYPFFLPTPPPGWYAANGQLISSADTVAPEAYATLQDPAYSSMIVSESQWQALNQASPYSGVGGVMKFVLDTTARTIRVPDLREMYIAGSSPTNVFAGTRRDMIPQILSGTFDVMGVIRGLTDTTAIKNQNGVFKIQDVNSFQNSIDIGRTGDPSIPSRPSKRITFDPSSLVGVGPVVSPRTFFGLWCVYLGLPES